MARRIGFRSFQDDDDDDEGDGYKKPEVNFDEHPVLNRFFQHYGPAGSFQEATEFYETADLVRMLWEQGCSVGAQELSSWLIRNGYRDEILQGMKTVWLLKVNADGDGYTNV